MSTVGVKIGAMWVRRILWLLSLSLLLPAQPILFAGCAHSSLRDDDEDYEDDEGDDDDDEDRPRRRRKRRKKASILIDYKRLSGAVVEVMASGRPRDDIDDLRSSRCDGSDDPVIFYQFVLGTHWHFYWLCSEKKPLRAATSEGNSILLAWVKQVTQRASNEGSRCSPGASNRLFKQSHESGTKAKVYCDGRIVLRFADGSTRTRRFTVAAGGYTPPRPVPSPSPRADPGRSVCPRCPVCPKVQTRRVDCPRPRPCPPPKSCPPAPRCPPQKACDCKPQARKAGEKGFWQGVKKACQRVCTLMYKKCRKIDPKTALCYQMSEYCAENCSKK